MCYRTMGVFHLETTFHDRFRRKRNVCDIEKRQGMSEFFSLGFHRHESEGLATISVNFQVRFGEEVEMRRRVLRAHILRHWARFSKGGGRSL